MCLRRRFRVNSNTSVAPGAKELILDLEERCCIRQLTLIYDGNDTTGTFNCRLIIKIDEDTVLNETLKNIYTKFGALTYCAHANRPYQTLQHDGSSKLHKSVFLDLGRVERRFAIFFENKDTSNPAYVHCGVIYDILED